MAAATLGGLQLNDHLQYRSKVNYFSGLTEHVRLNSPEWYKKEKYYLPDWTNNALWARWYKAKTEDTDGRAAEVFKSKYPTQEEFRDFCYAETKRDEEFKACSYGGSGWCELCFRKPEWDTPKT